ncbi:PucR family transcriptional regulator [Saccharopolyspora rosea]|uniref:PucR family transcriptional regulator n=1 Tax=Saccharopolyspora rosea TaxID=524884 RepID=A0ABW3G0K5_9PSEU|nr:helix-turn-helix domain-containing protein [Saccharopolyspora rosea]
MTRADPLTVAELLSSGAVSGTEVGPAGDERPVHAVRLVDRIEEIGGGVPHTACVLSEAAARGGWAVEAALRRAWERAAACVLAPAAAISSPSADLVASRLGVPLIAVSADPREVALRLAAAVAEPEAARAALTARCALRVAQAGPSARAVLGVLNGELPGVRVALVDVSGEVVAGRRAAAQAWRDGLDVVVEPVVGVGGAPLGRLVAATGARSEGWRRTVRDVLAVAKGQVTAWAAAGRLEAERRPRTAAALLRRVLDGERSDSLLEGLAAVGWPTGGVASAVAVVPVDEVRAQDAAALDAEFCSVWETGGPGGVLAPEGGAWIGFLTGRDGGGPGAGELAAAAEGVRRLAERLPVAAGVGRPVDATAGLAESVRGARAAATVARQQGSRTVLTAESMGVRSLLAALPDHLADTAREVLPAVLDADDGEVLLATLGAVLDAGGSVKDAARVLGVHRNTVTARLERLRGLGVEPDDPARRLALHLACHLLR